MIYLYYKQESSKRQAVLYALFPFSPTKKNSRRGHLRNADSPVSKLLLFCNTMSHFLFAVHIFLLMHVFSESQYGIDQLFCIFSLWMMDDLVRCSHFHHLPLMQHQHSVTKKLYQSQIMTDKQNCKSFLHF